MTYWALKPLSTASDLSGTFNLSSATTFLNLLSVFYFIVLSFFWTYLPQGRQSLVYLYSFLFFVILSFFLDEEMIPASESSTERARNRGQERKVFDFSDTKNDSDILSLS